MRDSEPLLSDFHKLPMVIMLRGSSNTFYSLLCLFEIIETSIDGMPEEQWRMRRRDIIIVLSMDESEAVPVAIGFIGSNVLCQMVLRLPLVGKKMLQVVEQQREA